MIGRAKTPADDLRFIVLVMEKQDSYHHTPKRVPKWPKLLRLQRVLLHLQPLPPTSATYPSTAQLSESTVNLSSRSTNCACVV